MRSPRLSAATVTGLVVAACLLPKLVLACAPDGEARRYLAAIERMDWVTMQGLLASDARYTDLTMAHYNRPAIDLEGAERIVAFWRGSSEDSGTTDIGYTVTGCFETAGYHLVNLDIAISVAGEFWGVDKDQIVIPGKVVSVIRVVGGQIAEHHDYVSYADADRTVTELQAIHGRLDASR